MAKKNKNMFLVGLALLVIGVVLLMLGYQEYTSVGSKIADALGSRPSNKLIGLVAGGAASAVAGVAMVFKYK
jgi:hypothetical protein